VTRELCERRVLGAVRFVDAATRSRILEPLRVRAAGVRFVRNQSGHYVIFAAPGLEAHARSFGAPPAEPALASVPVALEVADPAARYVTRRSVIRLPRDPDPAHSNEPGSLFGAIEVTLFPSPSARTRPGWAVVRGSVVEAGTDRPLGGALLRVVRVSDSTLLARGMSDARGEALVAVPGIPVITFGEGAAVTETTVDVALSAVFDPAAGAVADPDDLEARRAALPTRSFNGRLSSGRLLAATFAVALP
jgi:hypothetical protein